MRTVKIYATEIVKHELIIELDNEAFQRLMKEVEEEKYQEIAEGYLDNQTAVDSEFEEDDVDIYVKNSDDKFVFLLPLEDSDDVE